MDKTAHSFPDQEDQEVVVQLVDFLLEVPVHPDKVIQVLEMVVEVVQELQVVGLLEVRVVIIPNMLL